jgi:hypothetical protein
MKGAQLVEAALERPLYVMLVVGVIVAGIGMAPSAFSEPLSRLMLSLSGSCPWSASWSALFALACLLFLQRLLPVPLYVRVFQMSKAGFWFFMVLLCILDGILLCFIAEAAGSMLGSTWTPEDVWLVGAYWPTWAILCFSVGLFGCACTLTVMGFGVIKLFRSAAGQDDTRLFSLLGVFIDVVVYLPIAVAIPIIHRGNAFLPTILLCSVAAKALASFLVGIAWLSTTRAK